MLDVGAGYGRFSHRAALALPALSLVATDALPTSLALAEAYLRHRQLPASRARVLPPHRLAELAAQPPRLAVMLHSLPEMSAAAGRWWLEALAGLRVRNL